MVDALQHDLFAPAPPPRLPDGLASGIDLIDPAEEQALIARIDATSLALFRFQGWTGKRRTASFGWHYDFDQAAIGAADPIPLWLLPLRARAAAFAALAEADLVQALLIRYDPGAGIGWHRDRPVFDHVVGVSLGAAATLRLRRRTPDGFDRAQLMLAPRSVYHLRGAARHRWEHSIAPIAQPRWSITFRSFAAIGRAMRDGSGTASAGATTETIDGD